MPIVKDREYRALVRPMEARAQTVKRFNSDFYAEGLATTFDSPYLLMEWNGNKYYEAIDRKALDGADLNDVIMQYDHQGKVLARMSNNTLLVEPSNEGLLVAADLSKSQEARALHEEINSGLVTKMSWAFSITEKSYNKETRTVTILKIGKVYDVSAVAYPANGDTEISARSFFNGVIETEKREALARKIRMLKLRLDCLKAAK